MYRIILFACFVSMKLHCLQGFKFSDDWSYSSNENFINLKFCKTKNIINFFPFFCISYVQAAVKTIGLVNAKTAQISPQLKSTQQRMILKKPKWTPSYL